MREFSKNIVAGMPLIAEPCGRETLGLRPTLVCLGARPALELRPQRPDTWPPHDGLQLLETHGSLHEPLAPSS